MKRFLLIALLTLLLPFSFVQASTQEPYRSQQSANNHDTNQVNFTFEDQGILNQSFVNISSGAAEVQVPISVPPGINGLQPNFTLSYNSQLVNTESEYGFGWSLNIGEISRVNKHGIPQMYGDNPIYRIAVDDIVGQLVLLSSTATEQIYGLKQESAFAHIVYHLQDDFWEVKTQSGKIYILGQSSSARMQNDTGEKVFSWKVESVEDLHGNHISYTYEHLGGVPYLKRVTYGGLQGSADPFIIKFLPFDKSGIPNENKTRTRLDYSRGFGVSLGHLVTEIQIEVDASTRMKYKFFYTADELGSRDHLKKIKLTGYNLANQSTVQNLTFKYFDRAQGYNGELAYRRNLLRQVKFPQGGKITYDYLPTTQFLDDAGIKVAHHMHYPLIAVESVKKSGPQYQTNSSTYHYSDAYFHYDHIDERQMAGFGRVTETNPLGEDTKYYFHQAGGFDGEDLGEFEDTHWSLIGKLYRTEKYDNQDNLVHRSISQWFTEDLQDGRYFPQEQFKMQTILGQGSDPDTSTALKTVYDSDNGTVLEVVEYGEVQVPNDGSFTDIGIDSRRTIYTYASNAAEHLDGFISSIEVRNHTDVLMSRQEFLYDNLSLGSVLKGNQTTQKQRFIEESRDITTSTTYNSAGLITAQIDANNNQSIYAYGPGDFYPATTTNPLGHVSAFTYDRFHGKVLTMTDPNGLDTETVYDGLGRVVQEKREDPQTNQFVVIKERSYEEGANPHSVTQLTHISDANSLESITYTDAFGRIIQSRIEGESGQYSVLNTEYDALDRVKTTSLPIFENGSAYNANHGSSQLTSTTYDALGRVISLIDSIGTTTISYSGWEKQVTDPEGNTKRTVSDAFNHLVLVEEDLGSSTLVTTYEYDALDRLKKLTDASGNIREFEHDSLNRITKQDDLHNALDTTFGEWEYSYDDNGKVLTAKNPKGEIVLYTYDELNRITSEQKQGDPSTLITYDYDTGVNQKGRLTGINKLGVDWVGNYDLRGRLISENQDLSGSTYTKSYSYTPYDLPEQITYPNTKTIDYGYDSIGNLVSIYQGANTVIADLQYSPTQKLKEIDFGNGVESVFEYDLNKQYRLVRKQSTLPGGSPATLQDIFYTYDKVGNITNLTENGSTAAARVIDYTYDDLYRLTEADNTTANEVRTYAYDAIGNIIKKSDQGDYTYGEPGRTNPQAVTEITESGVSKKRFIYDDAGNLIRQEEDTALGTIVSEFDWDHYNRMTESRVTDEALITTTTTYIYNSAGIRLQKTVDDGTTSFTTLYPFSDYELTQANTAKISVSAGNSLVAVIESDSTSSNILFHHNDHLGGSNIVTDATGAVAQVIDYHPFGETRVDVQSASYDSTQKFTGHELDDSTNLYYAKARYYDPSTGRFISQDPLLHRVGEFMGKFADKPQGLGMYTYVMNNPILFVDPEGEETKVYIERSNLNDGAKAIAGHSFIEITRNGESVVYSWGGVNPESDSILAIVDSEAYFAQAGKNDDFYEVYTFQTSTKQEEDIDDFYRDLEKKEANGEAEFFPFHYNCADVSVDALEAGDIIPEDVDMLGPDRPGGLGAFLDKAHDWQKNVHKKRFLPWIPKHGHVMTIYSKEEIQIKK